MMIWVWTGTFVLGAWVIFGIGVWFGLKLPHWAEQQEREEEAQQ